MKIQVIMGSTRPGRAGESAATWVYNEVRKREDIDVELVDIADYALPLLDEPMPASSGQYLHEHTKAWSEKINEADAYIFVTPEYNHSFSAALKNAIDYLNKEWSHKAAAFVSYGASANGMRAVEQLRLVMGEIRIADIRPQIGFNLMQDFESFKTLKQPGERYVQQLDALLDELIAWAQAMRSVRLRLPMAQQRR